MIQASLCIVESALAVTPRVPPTCTTHTVFTYQFLLRFFTLRPQFTVFRFVFFPLLHYTGHVFLLLVGQCIGRRTTTAAAATLLLRAGFTASGLLFLHHHRRRRHRRRRRLRRRRRFLFLLFDLFVFQILDVFLQQRNALVQPIGPGQAAHVDGVQIRFVFASSMGHRI
mgnify:CR=1 FL=1